VYSLHLRDLSAGEIDLATLVVVALFTGLGLAAPSRALERFQAAAPVDGETVLAISLDRGAIEVESGGSGREVRIEARVRGLGASSVHFRLLRRGGRLVLEGRDAPWLRYLGSRPRVVVRALVPHDLGVELETRGGPVDVRRLSGEVRIRSGGGPVRLSELRGPAQVDSRGGAVELRGVEATVRIRTRGGPIVGRWQAAPRGELETSGGDADLTFPSRAALDLDARSAGGRLELVGLVPGTGPHEDEGLRIAVNGGGALLRVRGSGGAVHLRAAP
jgi:hypothetical protein